MTAVRGLGDGAVGRAPGPRHPRTAAAYAPLFCAGGGNRENDDAEGPNTQLLWVGLTESECTSTTLLLLASYLGGNVTASDLRCEVGPPDLLPPPFTFTPKSRISSRNGCHRRCCLEPLSCAAAPVPRCRHPAHPTRSTRPLHPHLKKIIRGDASVKRLSTVFYFVLIDLHDIGQHLQHRGGCAQRAAGRDILGREGLLLLQ